jgi:2,5-diketo-D-gluconate reductase A
MEPTPSGGSTVRDDMTINLAGGIQMPIVGFGTYLIPDEQARDAVSRAIRAGYRHVDTAEGYGNEGAVGSGVREAAEALGISREDVFITTKLWPGNPAWGEPAKTVDATMEALEASLARLQMDYVDLYLIHAPFAGVGRLEQWRALVELRRQGKAKAIGVSNFSIAHIEEIITARLPLPAANQIELHPWSQKPELVSYLANEGIAPIAYSSLVPLASWRSAEGQDSAKTVEMKAEGDDAGSPFKAMAEKYAVSEAQVLLRWAVQKGYAVLPKSTQEERIRQNLDLFSFEIDAGDMAAMARMDRGDGVAWAVGDPTKAGPTQATQA